MTIGIALALGSALVWGSGDFCGGVAARRHDAFQVLGVAAVSGVVMLLASALLRGETFVLGNGFAWAAAAGCAGALGIVSLYRGLAVGRAAAVAPTAAVVAAAVPVLFSALTQGLPARLQLFGFVIALAGIWLVARSAPDGPASRESIRLGAAAGVGFGGFLILIAQVDAEAVFAPLAVARAMMLAAAVAVLTARRVSFPGLWASPMSLLAGALDAGGNVLYLFACQHVRVDTAAVLSSLYPVATVLLARVVTGEPVARSQWAGAVVCLVAVVLIAA